MCCLQEIWHEYFQYEISVYFNLKFYFYRGEQVYPSKSIDQVKSQSKQVSFSERVVSENNNKSKRSGSERVRADIHSERVRAEIHVRDEDLQYTRVDETTEYVEFMKEISTNTYNPNDFVQVEWGNLRPSS